MKKLLLLLMFLLSYSCAKKNDEINYQYLKANWFGITDNVYTEYYFEKNHFYYYSVSNGNSMKFRYEIKKDSLFRLLDLPGLEKKELKFYSILKKFDENQLNTKFETLYRYNDSISLENLIKGKINYEDYDIEVRKRAAYSKKLRE